jgi:exosome complex component CSL4
MSGAVVVCPGDRLGRSSQLSAGPGTYVRGGYLFASLVGSRVERDGSPPMVMVEAKGAAQDQVIEVGDIVMGRITRVRSLQASVEVLCAGDAVLREPASGVIRKEDVREKERDKVNMGESFRPGDIVRARVISLGDSRYFLSTAQSDLGVRWAKSESGAIMVPISWTEMQCPKSGAKEARKCAKPA